MRSSAMVNCVGACLARPAYIVASALRFADRVHLPSCLQLSPLRPSLDLGDSDLEPSVTERLVRARATWDRLENLEVMRPAEFMFVLNSPLLLFHRRPSQLWH